MRNFLVLLFIGLISCTPRPPLTNPSNTTPELDSTMERDTTSIVDSIEAAPLVDSTAHKRDTQPTIDFATVVDTLEEMSHSVRVLLTQNSSSISLFSYGRIRITNEEKKITISPGVVHFKTENNGIRIAAHGKSTVVNGPLNIYIIEGQKLFAYDKNDYRGNMKIIGTTNGLMLLNVLPVETYLRGVVPLEIGRKGVRDSSAVQAQAIAARTYTYKRMKLRKDGFFDLYSTVSDQVYGGASAEHDGADKAILATKNKVMLYNNELVDAFYHSTCGGHTASRYEVWGDSDDPYLQGRSDLMSNGIAYCDISPLYIWKQSWSIHEFSDIVEKFSARTSGQQKFYGNVSKIEVKKRTSSGRVALCTVYGPEGTASYGGDKIRSVFRRPIQGNGILYSSNFSVVSYQDSVILSGKGFGHGIGMCQMGAIGRARTGQTYSQILKAYYNNITIEDVDEYFDKQRKLSGK